MFSFSYFLLVNFDPTKGFIKADSKSTLTHFIMNHHKLLTLIQRTRETLVTGLVQKFIEPGTTIISDKFSPYFNLNSVGYIHLKVNHSENFVDPNTGTPLKHDRRCMESNQEKAEAMNGTVKSKLPSYLDEYNWRKCYPGDPFDNLLEAIAEFCPPN